VIAPQGTRQKSGRNLGIMPAPGATQGPQLKYAWRLFTKNTALCELVRGCIEGDT